MRARALAISLLSAIALCAALAGSAMAASAPAWELRLTPMPSNLTPGGSDEYLLSATNVGAAPATAPVTLSLSLPESLTPLQAEGRNQSPPFTKASCQIVTVPLTCETDAAVVPGGRFWAKFKVAVAPEPSGSSLTVGSVSGGGVQDKSTSAEPPFQAAPLPFGFLAPGLIAPMTEEDGSAAFLAASHPYQQTIAFGFPTEYPEDLLTNAGHPHEVDLDLPSGLIGDPAATPVLCSEAQLETGTCPLAAQVGVFEVTTIEGAAGIIGLNRDPLYNMAPQQGSPAELGVNIAGLGLFAHLFASVRTDGDYGIKVTTPDVLALGTTPIFEVQTQVWGDPSDPRHGLAGQCPGPEPGKTVPCPLPEQQLPFWTLPGHCTGQSDVTSIRADTWEQPGDFKEATYESGDLNGTSVSLTDCASLDFHPMIRSKPTTNLSDSPSGLDFDLNQPQDLTKNGRASAALRDAVVTLPAGMVVNPSQANGLEACGVTQIGLSTAIGATPIHFTDRPASCPEASKLGTVEVTSPLLARRNELHQLELDPETGLPLPEPLHGSVFLAEPFQNPFDSLLAVYLSVEDPKTGIYAKLAGRIEPDPQTGQLVATFKENPELPLQDVRLSLFKGARASLITPLTCGTHSTTTDLTPWSAPEGAEATPADSFQTTATPAGGACPAAETELPNAPGFAAGTLTRGAGSYSPFVLKLSREDGTQRLTGFDTLLPPGLTAKLAGIPACSDAAIAQAISRSKPEEGILEKTSPSCPSSSALGTVNVAAGAGPTPFHTTGTAYLAGPYKGAPSEHGRDHPGDRRPLRPRHRRRPRRPLPRPKYRPDPRRLRPLPDHPPRHPARPARGRRASSTGPTFTLNPTSCDPMAITGSAISIFGQSSPLSTPFQVGGCGSLPFKPKLSLQLKGKTKRTSHPTLIANLSAKPGEANIAKAQVKLPQAAFLDNAHIGTICTRVQFAAKSCPPGSVYGTVSATTPLLDYPLTGNVYLRSSTHQLPDLVADLNGPSSQPIEIALAGTTDSVKGALRNTFEAVPDAPVSKFHLELFGGKKGLIILSAGLCKSPKAQVQLDGQNGKFFDTSPTVRTSCPKKHKKKAKHHQGGNAHR